MWEGVGKRSEEPQMTPGYDEPKTIEELKTWFKENGYEPARTRFFAGVDVRSPKAFGVYQDELGDYIVYKNKADGTRVIRYQGPDEEFAVHELYQRFLEEIINQQTRWAAGQTTAVNSPIYSFEPKSRPVTKVHILLFIVIAFCSYFFTLEFLKWLQNSKGINLGVIVYMAPIMVMAFALLSFRAYILNQSLRQSFNSIPKNVKKGLFGFIAVLFFISAIADVEINSNGYYSINNNLYYRAGNTWYHYNDNDRDWARAYNIPSAFTSNDWRDYQNTSSHQGTYTSFERTPYYDDWRSGYDSDTSDDRDYDSWDSNDWDSGYTDWNSDW